MINERGLEAAYAAFSKSYVDAMLGEDLGREDHIKAAIEAYEAEPDRLAAMDAVLVYAENGHGCGYTKTEIRAAAKLLRAET